ncbi:DUF4082 domain-containing protein [Saccharothrix sp. DSM 118769]
MAQHVAADHGRRIDLHVRAGTLGYEWNTVPDNGSQPPGVAQMSRTSVYLAGVYGLKNWGDVYGSGTETHAITYYRHPSGSLVFGAGTVQWAWGVDNEHAFLTNTPTADVRMQQATINFLADMGVQATTLMAGLVQSGGITDTQAPTVAYTNVPAVSTVGVPHTFSGTVTDAAGQVGGVEVSTDGGARWHPAVWQAGQSSWSYTYTPSASGPAQLRVRAVDDSLNLSAPVSVSPVVAARTCPCGLWTNADAPAVPDNADGGSLELGVKWRANGDGYVRGVRFYKGSGNTGTHTGTLWSSTGQQLATGTFTAETASGWQTLAFPVPVAVTANTTYVASYFSPTGKYSVDTEYFSRKSKYLEPLTGLQAGVDGPNGVFRSGAGFPDRTSVDSNYWVDVLWAPDTGPDTRAPDLVNTMPSSGAGSVALNPTLTATYDEAVNPTSVQFAVSGPGGAITGTTSVTGNGRTAQFTPSAALLPRTAYSASVRVADSAGNQTSQWTWSFTTGATRPATCPCTVWDDFTRPAAETSGDTAPVEVGTKVRFDGKGEVLGVRFFKGAGNTGTHTGSLWSSTGLLLSTGTFTGESSSGWQTLTFTTPVVVQANTTYIVSYYAPNGRYAVTGGYFAGASADYGPVHALANGADGPNGLYRYGGGFPTSSYNAGNYWVDVVYRNGLNGDTTPPTLTARTPAVDAAGVALTTSVTGTFSEPVDPASAQVWLTDPAGAKLTGTVSLSGDQRTATWTPSGALTPGTTYGVSFRIADANGNAMPGAATWSFTTTTTASCPCSLFSTATTPAVTSAQDSGSYELGVRFSPTQSGRITGVKFYKGAGNTGTHTGSLWSATGQRLATGTFTVESDTGWQTLTFATPVTVAPGLVYTASYTTTTGSYANDQGYFQRAGVDAGPLTAPRNGDGNPNGVFQPGGGFPTMTYQGNNYWVDVVYTPNTDTTAPVMTGRTPLPDAVDVALTSTATASFNEPIDLTNTRVTVRDPGGATLAGAVTRSADQQTVIWTPAARLAASTKYTATVRAADVNGNLSASASTWSFTSTASQTCPCSLFSAATVPTTTAAEDTGAYELGVRFASSAGGSVTGVKFYKGIGNTGTHTGSLWSLDGTLLTTGTFSNETATGWQTLTFATAVPMTVGTGYIASYTTTTGRYAINQGYFGGYTVTSSPLTAPANAENSSNGVYRVGTGFPNTSFGANHYWVDVVLTR